MDMHSKRNVQKAKNKEIRYRGASCVDEMKCVKCMYKSFWGHEGIRYLPIYNLQYIIL